VDNPIVEPNEARAPCDVVHKHRSCGALTKHRRARYLRRISRPARVWGSLIAPWALPNMRGAIRSEAQNPVRCRRITIGWQSDNLGWTQVKRKREQEPRGMYPKSPSYSPVGKGCKTPRGQGRPGHGKCAKYLVECGFHNLPSECFRV
jgi:hypothetical protein